LIVGHQLTHLEMKNIIVASRGTSNFITVKEYRSLKL